MNRKKTPDGTISRLFAYLREVKKLSELGIKTISSSEIGDRLNLSDVQVRKDLGYFGSFGTSGAGYDTAELSKSLEKILGKDKQWNICIVGVGRLGSALMMYSGFKKDGLYITAAFDANPKKIGKVIESIKVESIENLSKGVQEKKISIAIIATPSEAAQTVADSLIKAGIECIMNFAPVRLNTPENVKVENVDLSHVLETLTYFVNN